MIETALKSIVDQGVLGAVLVILFLLFTRFLERLFKVVENNTKALEQNANAIQHMETTINRCHERSVV